MPLAGSGNLITKRGDCYEEDFPSSGPGLRIHHWHGGRDGRCAHGSGCGVKRPLIAPTDPQTSERLQGTPMKKLIVLVEALALAAVIVTVVAVNPQTGQMMVAASQAANGPHASAIEKIIAFARAAGNVAMLTVSPQLAKPRGPH
jgi:hypothetical protein